MNLFAISGLLISISAFVFCVFSWVKGKKLLNKIWAFFNLSVAIWGWGAYKFSTTLNQEEVFFWLRFGHIGVIFIPVLFLHFVFEFLEEEKKKSLYVIYLIGIFFSALNITDWLGVTRVFIVNLRYVFDSFYVDSPPGMFYPAFVTFFFCAVVYAHFRAFKYLKIYKGLKRLQIKYFLAATALGFGGGGTAFLMVFNIDIYPFPHFTIFLYPIIMTYAIFKYRLMDIKVAVTRAGIFLAVYALVLGIPFGVGYYTKLWIVPTSLAVIFATLGPMIYRVMQRKAENILLASQKRYQRMLLNAAKGMVSEHDLGRLLKLIVHVVKRAVKIEYAAIFIEDKEQQCYRLEVVRDHHKVVDNFSFSYDHPLINLIKKKRGPLNYEDIPSSERDALGKPMYLVVPSMVRDNLLAFLVLGEKEDHTIYTIDDISVFNTLSRQAALAIEHCIFLEEFKEAQEKIFQAEKLASIGGMASGIAHQIRNRLNHFAVAVGELKLELKDMAKKQEDLMGRDSVFKGSVEYELQLAESIDKNVKRTAAMITGMLDFAHAETEGIKFSPFSLKEIVDLTIIPLKTKHDIESLPLEFEYEGDDTIEGIKSQFVEVILNILDNAYEAIKEKVELRLSEEEKAKYQPFIKINLEKKADSFLIKISDNGVGVKEEDKQRIFAPFFTTKSSAISGTGIGMYVVKRMIEENHNGRIWFESQYMKGTEFYVELPKKEG
jgi:signal transduction histidine kinase